jgi:hypothetical protein
MRYFLLLLVCVVLQSCASINENNNYGFEPRPGMQEDSITNTKYNMMDSPDGMRDPNNRVQIWGATY